MEAAGDCDDTNTNINPQGREICDGADADEDCDGFADDGDPSVDDDGRTYVYADADGDGYGDPNTAMRACDLASGFAFDGRDCDDTDAATTIECAWLDLAVGSVGGPACRVRGSVSLACWNYGSPTIATPPIGPYLDVDLWDWNAGPYPACAVGADGALSCWNTDGTDVATDNAYGVDLRLTPVRSAPAGPAPKTQDCRRETAAKTCGDRSAIGPPTPDLSTAIWDRG